VTDEQRSLEPFLPQPAGPQFFSTSTSLLAPYRPNRSARRLRLVEVENPLRQNTSHLRDTTLVSAVFPHDDSCFGEIERGELEVDGVADGDADEVTSQLAGDMCEDGVTVREFHPKFVSRQDCGYGTGHLDLIVVQHGKRGCCVLNPGGLFSKLTLRQVRS